MNEYQQDPCTEADRRPRAIWTPLLLACACALCIGVAIPGLMRARVSSNETAAIGTMRTLTGSQACWTSAAS